MGRPKKAINPDLLYELASIQCTYEEMASICKCDVTTLRRRFRHVIEKGVSEGKRSLRRLQWQSAEKGNVSMQIWLGKQWLGQKERSDVTSNEQAILRIIGVPQEAI